jgi:protein O-GlcNAc transferase
MNGNNFTAEAIAGQIQQALALIHQGRLLQADALCRQVLTHQPRNFNASQLLGHIALQRQDYAGAAQWLRAAIGVNPSNAAVYSNLAVAMLALRRPQEALECCDRAITLNAHFPEAHFNRGNALCALERPEEGLISYERALSLAPNRADVWSSRGVALLKLHRLEEALVAFDRVLALTPQSAEALNNRGTVLRDLRQPAEAMASYQKALSIRPDFPEALCNVANIWLDSGRYAEAISCCDRALSCQPRLVDAFSIRGAALRFLNRHEEAAEDYGRVLALAPRFDYALSHLFFLRASLCDWSDRAEQSARILAAVNAGERASAPHTFLSISDAPSAQLQCARTFVANFPALTPLWQGDLYRHERIRVAYMSADFHDHPVAHLIAGVLEGHDRSRFETYGISLRREAGSAAMHRRMQQAFEHFHDVTEMSDRDVARLLRELEIDIAIDLNTHTRGGRLGILAYRPAPVQVNYLGFAGTSGTNVIDYLIADGVAIPSDQDDFFSERIVRLPHSFLPNDDRQPVAADLPRRRDLGLPETGFVFCGFNNPYKINPALFDIWMRLLRETPGSVLWLRSGESAMLANLAREAAARGVAPDRLVFAPKIPAMDAHLARYRVADLFLDTVPYGAHATARDALWAGLPVLTCVGNAFASRVAGSLMSALDLPELLASSLDEYASRALELAGSPALLGDLRARLAHQKQERPVFDTDLFRRHLELAFDMMWERRQRGAGPQSFTVPVIR